MLTTFFATAGFVLLASFLVTTLFAICATLCLPVGLCCGVGRFFSCPLQVAQPMFSKLCIQKWLTAFMLSAGYSVGTAT